MQNPHRAFETEFYGHRNEEPHGSFIQDFGRALDEFLAAPVNTDDPRLRVNMQPEPYRPAPMIASELSSLKALALETIAPNINKWQWLYESLSDHDSRRLLIQVVAYRCIGWKHVRLPLDNDGFWAAIGEIGVFSKLDQRHDFVAEKGLERFNLRWIGKDIDVFTDPFGVFNEFIYSQYFYRGFNEVVRPQPGDYVLDCGACYGGTTLNFADAVGPRGRVYSFEFLPSNVEVYRANVGANRQLLNRISLTESPVSSESDMIMSIVGTGPAAQVHFGDVEGAEKVKSIRIDDFVSRNGLPRLDFIKMDIEGSEINALIGAMSTIERFRPKLAICVYHNLSDFYEVPLLLKGIHSDYRLYFGHSSIHGDESVLFAV
ncbi:FkbM family methyltransferase [Rhizobium sp. PP-F2F-G38]|nr:FkbM family methyltransferase [Rhizobium sp. PP-F2F-G38]